MARVPQLICSEEYTIGPDPAGRIRETSRCPNQRKAATSEEYTIGPDPAGRTRETSGGP